MNQAFARDEPVSLHAGIVDELHAWTSVPADDADRPDKLQRPETMLATRAPSEAIARPQVRGLAAGIDCCGLFAVLMRSSSTERKRGRVDCHHTSLTDMGRLSTARRRPARNPG